MAAASSNGEADELIDEVARSEVNEMGDTMATAGGGGEASELIGETASDDDGVDAPSDEAAGGERLRRRTTKRRGRAGRSGFSRSVDAVRQQNDETREPEGAARV